MDGMLSQEEINALLGGMGEDGGSDSSDTQAGAGTTLDKYRQGQAKS